MRKLSASILTIIIEEYGQEELLRRISNPFWFQAFGCVIGHDFHSSGITTTVCAVLKSVVKPEAHGLGVAGGKGKHSRKTLDEIEKISETFNLSTKKADSLKYSSRMSAKVDNTAIQSGYPLYQHTFFLTEKGKWAVVQQGLNINDRTARRYHWLSDQVKSFVEEPHSAICCDIKKENVLDMTSKQSKEARRISVDLVREGPRRIKNDLLLLRPIYQKSLKEFLSVETKKDFVVRTLRMPKNVNWKAIEEAYELQPENYENLLSIKGIGSATVRSLALISEIIYGKQVSWEDPKKFSFCLGGKDGVPYPVNKKHYDEVIQTLEDFIKSANIEKREKLKALERLTKFKDKL